MDSILYQLEREMQRDAEQQDLLASDCRSRRFHRKIIEKDVRLLSKQLKQ